MTQDVVNLRLGESSDASLAGNFFFELGDI